MTPNSLKDKLLGVERTINTYKQNNEMIDEINIDNIPFEVLKSIVIPKNEDPLLYGGYILNSEQLERFNSLIAKKIEADFDLYFYVLECGGIYNW